MRHEFFARTRAASRAFSLIEIMVAVTLLTVITVGLLSMFYQTQKAFRLGASQVDILESGRATIQLLAREFQEMSPSEIENALNFSAVPTTDGRLVMDLPTGDLRTNLLQNISFLARRGHEWIGTSYRVATAGTNALTLFRATTTTNTGEAITPPTLSRPAYQSNVISQLFRDIAGPAVLGDDLRYHQLADGVVHLRVFAYNRAGQLFLPPDTPSADEYWFTNSVPAYLDIELGILDPKALEQFRARSFDPVRARDYLQGQSHRLHLFKQRVPIRARRSEFDLFALQ